MGKHREFWLAMRSDGQYDAFEEPCGDYSGYLNAIKVVDKKSLTEAQDEIKRLREAAQAVLSQFPYHGSSLDKLKKALCGA